MTPLTEAFAEMADAAARSRDSHAALHDDERSRRSAHALRDVAHWARTHVEAHETLARLLRLREGSAESGELSLGDPAMQRLSELEYHGPEERDAWLRDVGDIERRDRADQ